MSEWLVATYAAAWHETDARARRALIEQCWAPAGTYTDPTATVTGREALCDHIAAFHERRPGHRILITSPIDGHASHVRFAWAMRAPDGSTVLDGMDYAEIDDEGRISRIVGFFGALV
jgi:hypothetical protein